MTMMVTMPLMILMMMLVVLRRGRRDVARMCPQPPELGLRVAPWGTAISRERLEFAVPDGVGVPGVI